MAWHVIISQFGSQSKSSTPCRPPRLTVTHWTQCVCLAFRSAAAASLYCRGCVRRHPSHQHFFWVVDTLRSWIGVTELNYLGGGLITRKEHVNYQLLSCTIAHVKQLCWIKGQVTRIQYTQSVCCILGNSFRAVTTGHAVYAWTKTSLQDAADRRIWQVFKTWHNQAVYIMIVLVGREDDNKSRFSNVFQKLLAFIIQRIKEDSPHYNCTKTHNCALICITPHSNQSI